MIPLNKSFVAAVLIVALIFVPIQQIEAKGGITGGGLFRSIVTVVAIAVVSYFVPPLAAVLAEAQAALSVVTFANPVAVYAWNFAVGVIASGALCYGAGVSTDPFEGCGGGGGDNNGNSGNNSPSGSVLSSQFTNTTEASNSGGNLSCPGGYDLCGSGSSAVCIPEGNVCCANVGFTDRYCPVNTICRTDGQCEQDTGGSNCSENRGSVCTGTANSCGMTNNDRYLCDGSCPAVAPADSSCPTPNITLNITPAFINPNESCNVQWTSTNTTSCIVSGPGAPTASSTSGSFVTPPLTAVTNYTVRCFNGTVVNAQLVGQCRINPDFDEF